MTTDQLHHGWGHNPFRSWGLGSGSSGKRLIVETSHLNWSGIDITDIETWSSVKTIPTADPGFFSGGMRTRLTRGRTRCSALSATR